MTFIMIDTDDRNYLFNLTKFMMDNLYLYFYAYTWLTFNVVKTVNTSQNIAEALSDIFFQNELFSKFTLRKLNFLGSSNNYFKKNGPNALE